MRISRKARRAAGIATAVGTLLVAAPTAAATDVFAVTKKGKLAKFDTDRPGDVKTKDLEGLPDGVKLVGIDQRPSNGDLYGIGDDSTVYEISKQGEATAVGDGFDNPQLMPVSPGVPLDGNSFGVDFNPVPDAIRIVSNTGQNLRVSPTTGDLVAEDGDINGADGAKIVDAAYTNSQRSVVAPETATLYVLDASGDTIYTQNPPNDGTLTNPESIDVNITKTSSLDLIGSGNKGLLSERKGKSSVLYQVKRELDIGLEGETKKLGKVKAGSPLVGIAVDQPRAN